MAELPSVSVIIPARDSGTTLRRTLDALAAHDGAASFEVIVVDDGSEDDTAAVASRYPFVTVIRSEMSQGPGAARNRGVAAARGAVLAFTDADCIPTPGWLREGLAALSQSDLVQGRVAPDVEVARTPFDRTLEVDGDRGFYQTANLLMRRETFDRTGGFRDWALERPRRWSRDRRRGRASRTPIGEDTLLAWRAVRAGARSTFSDQALVHHAVVPGSVRDDMADHWHWTRDMPGLVALVPELRETTLFGRWFFNRWTAQFDAALLGLALAALSGRRRWLLLVAPYARRHLTQCRRYPRRQAVGYLIGRPAVEATALAGLLAGSVAWRTLVL